MEMNTYILAVLVKNQFGVLNRVTSMFRRRQFNISTLTVSETQSKEFSRITVIFEGDENHYEQLVNQLYKLPDVCAISELKKDTSVIAEVLLIKMKNESATRGDILAAAEAFDAKTVDYTKDSIVFQITADSNRIDEFINLMRDYDILEICRTGIVALQKGSNTISEEIQ